jgi:hypothetical protein
MEQSAKKKVLIWGSLLVIAGVGGYFLWKKFGKKKPDTAPETAPSTGGGDPTQPVTQITTTQPVSTSSPLSTSEDIKKFQDWMDVKHPNWVQGKNLNKGGGYGSFGPSTSTAWNKWGAEYKTPATTTLTPEQLKAQKDKAYNDAWNSAKAANSPTFVFEGRAYNTATGKVYVDPAVIQVGDDVYATKKIAGNASQNLEANMEYWTGGTSLGNFYKNELIGKVTKVAGKALGVENTFKPMVTSDGSFSTKFWVKAESATKVKPSSYGFDGVSIDVQDM